jgi:hypothetical protein
MKGCWKEMDSLNALFDTFFEILYNHLIEPILNGIVLCLNILISPLNECSPRTQIIFVALLAAVISRLLTKRFGSKREKSLLRAFQERISTLKHTEAVQDENLKRAVKKGIHEAADAVYEKILLDKFYEMGTAYFFPLFFFLLWLEYNRFPPETLMLLTGSPHVWATGSGAGLSAAYTYLYFFNIFLLILWILEVAVRRISKRLLKVRPMEKGLSGASGR